VEAELSAQAVWFHEQVREILREADPSAWRADKAEALRQRVRSVVATLKRRLGEDSAAGDGSANATVAGSENRGTENRTGDATGTPSLLVPHRLQSLRAAMERALPVESTRSRWAAFVGEVHPAYEALLASLPATAAVPNLRPTNYARSLMHFSSSAVGCASVALFPSRKVQIAISLAFFTYAWSMEGVRRVSPRFNVWLMGFYKKVAHPHEHFRVNSATWFATALLLLACFATRPGMMAGLAVLGVADPIAALVGRRWGKHTLRAGRSLEGTLAFFASGTVAAAIALALVGTGSFGTIAPLAALAGFVGAIAELATRKLDDNLTIPLVVGVAVTLGTLAG
jgi:dolichol kinase